MNNRVDLGAFLVLFCHKYVTWTKNVICHKYVTWTKYVTYHKFVTLFCYLFVIQAFNFLVVRFDYLRTIFFLKVFKRFSRLYIGLCAFID